MLGPLLAVVAAGAAAELAVAAGFCAALPRRPSVGAEEEPAGFGVAPSENAGAALAAVDAGCDEDC